MVYSANAKLFTRSLKIKGFKFAIFISIVIHFLIVLLLIKTTDKPIEKFTKTTKVKPISSFIYYKPQEKKQEKVKSPPLKDDNKEIKETSITQVEKVEPQNIATEEKIQSKSSIQPTEILVPPTNKQQAKPVKNYTNAQRLSRLKDKISQQISEQAIYNYSKPNTGSVMHGKPNYVPHSFVEDVQKKAIGSTPSQVGNGFSIQKDDNGSCTLTEDLSNIGLQGKMTSGFKCGLSKDEKAFNSHMKKVLKKLGK